MSNRIESINLTAQRMVEVVNEMSSITTKATVTKADEMRHQRLLAEYSALKGGATPQELAKATTESLRKELGLPRDYTSWNGRSDRESRESWLAFVQGRDAEVRSEFRPRPEFDTEHRNTSYQSTSEWGNVIGASYAGSGYFVPADYDNTIRASLASVDGIADKNNCTIIETVRGAAMTSPSIDDVVLSGSPVVGTPVASVRVDQSTSSSNGFVRTGSAVWGATPTYRSGIVYVATELEQDSAFTMQTLLNEVFMRRHALGYGAECINGSGVAQTDGVSGVPLGLLTAITANAATIPTVTASNPVSSAGYINNYPYSLFLSDLQRLWKSLPKQYRDGFQGRNDAKFYMSSGTAFVVMQALSSNVKGASADYFGYNKLFGHDIVICDTMADASDQTSPAVAVPNAIVFANSKYLLARHVKNASYIRRFTQSANAIEAGLTGFESFFRADFRPILFESTQPPVAVLNFPA
jgi:HK97 family phage major capsid protein